VLFFFLKALAQASLRDQAEDMEEAGQWAQALDIWQQCAEQPGADQRLCENRAALLEPQRADQFQGWSILSQVRRNYKALGSSAATLQIEQAASKGGPGEAELLKWLANEYSKTGQLDKLTAIKTRLEALGPTEARLAILLVERQEREARRSLGIKVLSGLAVGVGLVSLGVGKGGFPIKSALGATLLVGMVPLCMAWLYEPSWGGGFLALTGVVGLGALLGPRLPFWASGPGILAAFGAVALYQRWWLW
jgi:hypothetical protein